jgi:hypothetical protein
MRLRTPHWLFQWQNRVASLRSFDGGVAAVPSELAKHRHLLRLIKQHELPVFIESGTYLGDTTAFLSPHVRRAVTIEIDDRLHSIATRRLARYPNVEVIHGDARDHIPRLVSDVPDPCLIWLDGHCSGEGTGKGGESEPAVDIIEILARTEIASGTTIVVDDLRLFGTDPEWPSLERLVDAAQRFGRQVSVSAQLDALVLRITT